MTNSQKKGSASRRMPAWAIVLLTCAGGCLVAVLLLAIGVGGIVNALMAPKVPPPAAYAGVWRSADGSVLAVGNDGAGSFRSGATSVTGGRVKVDEAGHRLSIKLAGIGQDWRIDTPPNGTVMTLNGVQFKRTAATSSGVLATGGVTMPR